MERLPESVRTHCFKCGVRADKCPVVAATSWKHRGAQTPRAALQNVFDVRQLQEITCIGPRL